MCIYVNCRICKAKIKKNYGIAKTKSIFLLNYPSTNFPAGDCEATAGPLRVLWRAKCKVHNLILPCGCGLSILRSCGLPSLRLVRNQDVGNGLLFAGISPDDKFPGGPFTLLIPKIRKIRQ